MLNPHVNVPNAFSFLNAVRIHYFFLNWGTYSYSVKHQEVEAALQLIATSGDHTFPLMGHSDLLGQTGEFPLGGHWLS